MNGNTSIYLKNRELENSTFIVLVFGLIIDVLRFENVKKLPRVNRT